MPTREEIKNAYQTLGLSEDSSKEDIKNAYRKLSLKWHPDKFGQPGHLAQTREEATEKFKEISNAKDILDNKDNVESNYNNSYTSENLATQEDKEEAKSIIRENLVKTEFTQTEFENLMRQVGAEHYIDFSSKIDKLNTRDEVLTYLGGILDAITICYQNKLQNKLDSEWENVFRENDNWRKTWQNAWESSKTSNNYSWDNWEEELTKNSKEKDIDEIKFHLNLKSVSEDQLNKKLGVSDWKNEINKQSGSSESLQRMFEIKNVIYALAREFTCAHCKQKNDGVWAPWEKYGEKFCSYEHQAAWARQNGKANKGSAFGSAVIFILLIAGIVWLIRRRKKIINK